MRAKVWGCRGSLATPGHNTLRYGGNTSCVEVTLKDGTLIVLDAGTGIRSLGMALAPEPPDVIHLLLTHLHLDHIEGLGFFLPLWNPEIELHIWGPSSPLMTLEERLARYLSPPLFPLDLAEANPPPHFHDVPDTEWSIGSARISALPVAHPGPTVGYLLSEDSRSLAYIPDHEPGLGKDLMGVTPDWVSGFGLTRKVDVLLHDSQYTEKEYPRRMGWGHSSIADAVALASISEVGQLVMFHHDPSHDDAYLEDMATRAKQLWQGNGDAPALAREGMDIDLS